MRDEEPLLNRRLRAVFKVLTRSVVRVPTDGRRVLLIFGCQRSGTTMLQQSVLDCSWRVRILEEHDRRLVRPNDRERLRWSDMPVVAHRLRQPPFELVVAKPLVESHRVRELLDAIDRTKGIWMLRHFAEVARSNLSRFGADNGYRDLTLMVSGAVNEWRARVSTQTQERVSSLLDSNLMPLDAAAVFWWARNCLYLEQELWSDERVRIMRYEALLERSTHVLADLADFLGVRLAVPSISRRIRPRRTPASTGLRPDIERLCAELYESFGGRPEVGAS